MTCPPTADCWFLSGPTASGKTAVSLALASGSMQKSSRWIPWLFIGAWTSARRSQAPATGRSCRIIRSTCWSLTRSTAWRPMSPRPSESRAKSIARRQALFVGGTPLYLKALLRGIFVGPPADWELRERLATVESRSGPGELHRRLAAVDPISARRLHPERLARRIIRALEVYREERHSHQRTAKTV